MIRLNKEILWVFAGYASVFLVNIALVKLLTNAMSPSDYGLLALLVSLGTFASQISTNYSFPGITRNYLIAKEKGNLIEFSGGALSSSKRSLLIYVFSSLILTIVLFFSGIIESLLALMYLFLLRFFLSIFNIQNALLNIIRKRIAVSIVELSHAFVKLGIIFLLIKGFQDSLKVTWVLQAYLLSVIIGLIIQFFITRITGLYPKKEAKSHHRNEQDIWKKKILAYSRPFFYYNIFTWFQSSVDRWSLELFSSRDLVGIYTGYFQLSYMPMTILSTLIVTYISPILFEISGDGQDATRNEKTKKMILKLVHYSLLLVLILAILGYYLRNQFLDLFLPTAYTQYSYALPLFIIAGGLFSISQLMEMKLKSDMNSQALLIPKITNSVLCILFAMFGAYYFDFYGVVFGLLLFTIINFIWFYKLCFKNK